MLINMVGEGFIMNMLILVICTIVCGGSAIPLAHTQPYGYHLSSLKPTIDSHQMKFLLVRKKCGSKLCLLYITNTYVTYM